MNVVIGLVLGALFGVAVLRRRRGRADRDRARAMEAGLPLTLDLISVVLGAGGTIHDAVGVVAANGPEPVRSVFGAILARRSDGLLLVDALVAGSDELGPSFHPLVGALVATERDGAPISLLLQRLADDVDQARRWQAEAAAKRVPVALLVPLVVCLLPAVIVGSLVPLVIIALRQLNI